MKSFSKKSLLKLVSLLIIWTAILVFISLKKPPPRELPRRNSAIYVWQRVWNGPVKESVGRILDRDLRLMVLAGEFNSQNGSIIYTPADIDFTCIEPEKTEVSLVFRLFASVAGKYDVNALDELVPVVTQAFRSSMAEAQQKGIGISDIQVDFDCPSSKLDFFRSLLVRLRRKIPETRLSITALPTYLRYPKFRGVVSNVDYFVLQVHGIEKPESIDSEVSLWKPKEVERWLLLADRIGVPFYIALPTYGYELVFDEKGKYAGIRAEGEDRIWPAGYTRTIIMSQPEDVLEVLSVIKRTDPKWLIGTAWFRMPVEGDEVNWPWETFNAVLEGRIPVWSFSTEIRKPDENLWEIWVRNDGERHGPRDISFNVKWTGMTVMAYDVLGGFYIKGENNEPTELVIVGKAPPFGAPVIAAWFRASPPIQEGGGELKVSEVKLK